jgi:hypothetical protein
LVEETVEVARNHEDGPFESGGTDSTSNRLAGCGATEWFRAVEGHAHERISGEARWTTRRLVVEELISRE